MIKLTKEQEKHSESVRWLLNGPRRSGKSFLAAYEMIKLAIEQPNIPVEAIGNFTWGGSLVTNINKVAEHMGVVIEINLNSNYIVYRGEKES